MSFSYIRHINNRLLFNTEPKSVQVAILLGGRGVSGEIARQAAFDYRKTKAGLAHYFNKIIVCGGMPVQQKFVRPLLKQVAGTTIRAADFETNMLEADYMKQVLLGDGVYEKDIIVTEATSRHTGENFANIRQFVIENNILTANIYTTAYHARRAIETAAVEIPSLQCNPVSVWPYGLSADQWRNRWYKNPVTAHVVLGEYRKINPKRRNNYYAQGICKPLDF